MRVGAVQLPGAVGDPGLRLRDAEARLTRLARRGVGLVVLPEFFATGYDLDTPPADAAAHATDTLDWLHAQAVAHDQVLVTAIPVHEGDLLRDRAVVVDRTGVRATGDKRFLWGREGAYFERGLGDHLVVDTAVGTVGVAICYEAGFPEVARDLAVRGADIIAVPAAFGRPRLHAWELMTRSRALENGCFVVAAGLTGGNDHGVVFAGHSRVVDPRGDVVASIGLEPGEVDAEIDLATVGAARAEIPYLTDLRRTPAGRAPRSTVVTRKDRVDV